jgi:hypothetical protein
MKPFFLGTLTIIFLVLVYFCKDNNLSKNKNNAIQVEIEKFVHSVDSIPRSIELQNVLIIEFSQEKEGFFFTIKTCYFYPDKTKYYYFVGEFMIAFKNETIYQDNNWIINLKKVPIPKKYKNETEIHFRPFEPQIQRFQIINADSIQRVSNIN